MNANNPEETGMSVSRGHALAPVLVFGTRGGQRAIEEIASGALQLAT
jgi:hypothetical protein